MEVQEKLILLMQAKEDVLVELGICVRGEYFMDEDAEELAGWGRPECLQVWDGIRDNINWYRSFGLLYGFLEGMVCPWCQLKNIQRKRGCGWCGYGKRHGLCDQRGSSWRRIRARGDRIPLIVPDIYPEVLGMLEKL